MLNKTTEKIDNKFLIIRDTQEKANIWNFNKSKYCDGVIDESLETGDYTLRGLENIFTIERKASTGELAGNLYTRRFENELKRGRKLKRFYLILEFSLADMLSFPYNSGIPKRIWPKLRTNASGLLKRLIELEHKYNIHVVFAGNNDNAREIAKIIFKEMWLKYGSPN